MMNKSGNFKSIFLLVMIISFISSCGSGLDTITMDYKEANDNKALSEIDMDTVPPGKVVVTGISSTATTVTLDWTDPGAADLDHIRISWDPNPASENVAVGIETLEVTGLTTDVDYTFTIAAVDSAGNESPATVSAKPSSSIVTFYLIYTAAELYNVRNDLGGYYSIMDDIDLSGYPSWTPIGDTVSRFTGTVDGGGHTITGLTINAPASDDQGLFGYIDDASIKNLNIDGFTIAGNDNLGALAGHMKQVCYISNCHVKGTIYGNSSVGGLIGTVVDNGNYISKSSAQVAITITGATAGGLVGEFLGVMSDSYARGGVTGDSPSEELGGLVGHIQSIPSPITDCYASVTVTGGASNLGGIIGGESATPDPVITDTFYDTTGSYDNTYGDYWSTANMKLQSTYTGWDFVDTWGMDPLINDGYPYLKSNQLY